MSSVSELQKLLFDGLNGAKQAVQAIAPGLANFGPEVKAELSRLNTQGTMELASALFGGSAFVPYGPGQYTPSVEPEKAHATPSIEHEMEHSMER